MFDIGSEASKIGCQVILTNFYLSWSIFVFIKI